MNEAYSFLPDPLHLFCPLVSPLLFFNVSFAWIGPFQGHGMSGYAAEGIASDLEPVGETGAKAKSIYDKRIKLHLFSKPNMYSKQTILPTVRLIY